MAAPRLTAVFRTGPAPPAADPRPDADLLARFLAHADEAAFAALVARHTPAVRAVCRGWLRSAADVDDAAQATFLVLVRRADAIRDQQALAAWLYRVAGHTARRLRAQLSKTGPLPADVPAREPAAPDERADLIAAEVARLPEKYRLPVQLCYAAGLTTQAAGDRLGLPKGTVLTRLARARRLLQRRLAARGVAAAALGAVGASSRAVSPEWVKVTAAAARGLLAGAPPGTFGVSDRTVSLSQGVVNAMVWQKFKVAVAAAALATGLFGFAVGQWTSADAREVAKPAALPHPPTPPADPAPAAVAAPAQPATPATPNEAKPPAAVGRRQVATIRIPAGTFVKEVDVPPYGSARITWTYQDDRVAGLIEASVMGFEVEVATDAEFSLSSNGTIYGVLNGVKVNHVRVPAAGDLGELAPYAALWPVVEPLINEAVTDLPFSYQFRVTGDRLTIHNYRILLAGPNPVVGKQAVAAAFGGSGGDDGIMMVLAACQALGTAVEGTYTAADAVEPKPAPKKRTGVFPMRSRSGGFAPSFGVVRVETHPDPAPVVKPGGPPVPTGLPTHPIPPGPGPRPVADVPSTLPAAVE